MSTDSGRNVALRGSFACCSLGRVCRYAMELYLEVFEHRGTSLTTQIFVVGLLGASRLTVANTREDVVNIVVCTTEVVSRQPRGLGVVHRCRLRASAVPVLDAAVRRRVDLDQPALGALKRDRVELADAFHLVRVDVAREETHELVVQPQRV